MVSSKWLWVAWDKTGIIGGVREGDRAETPSTERAWPRAGAWLFLSDLK